MGYGQLTLDDDFHHKLTQINDRQREEQQRRMNTQQALTQFETLSENEKQLHQLQQRLNTYQQSNHLEQKIKLSEIKQQSNALISTSPNWKDTSERQAVVDLLTKLYNEIGWYDKGKKKNQREKQIQKKQAALKSILTGST